MTGIALVGRESEQVRLAQFLAAAQVLVIRGEAGIGKTALLEHTVRTASEHRVVRVRAVAAEAELPYSALHLVCSALADQLPSLAPHHRQALETAVGLRSGPAPDRLAAGVATLALLTCAAQARPLLCAVDDAQCLDEDSAFVLAFVARRLGAAPVALLFADRGNTLPSLPELRLGGLAPSDARRLLDGPIDVDVAERIVLEARGNPRALVESAYGACAGGYRVPASHGEHPLPAGLYPDATLLLLLAAAEPLGDPARVWRAAARLGIAARAAEQLEAERLVSFGTRVVFRDPRLRCSVYGRASAMQRRRVHGALATDSAPERRAWHLAQSLVGPDDAVGDELERTARIAGDRGGLPASAAFLERATQCTAEPGHRARRAIMAAEAHYATGATEPATQLLATAELGQLSAVDRARLVRLRARITFDHTRCHEAVSALLTAAAELERHEPQLARGAYFETLGAAILTGHPEATHTAMARIAGVEPLKLALKTLAHDHDEEPRARLLACLIAPELWDDEAWHEQTRTQLARARQVGDRATLPYLLNRRARYEVHTGQFGVAESLMAEAAAVAAAIGAAPCSQAASVLAAWRGQPHPNMEPYAKAVLCNGLGAYTDAVAAVRPAIEDDAPELRGWSLVELVEAGVRAGDLDAATAALDRLAERAELSGTEWALGIAARSRALLADNDAAEESYVEAIDRLGRTRITVHVARTQLVYGEWLRRQGRRVDARVPLRAAHQSFTDMGAAAFAGRAMRELLATGERARRRVEETRDHLTPQETQIAALARDGRSNPEIATLLSISPRTVEYHLHKVFTKLRITSRTELHLVLR